MEKIWPWISGIAIGLIIVLLLVYGGSNREAYWIARGPMTTRVIIVQPASEELSTMRLHHYFER